MSGPVLEPHRSAAGRAVELAPVRVRPDPGVVVAAADDVRALGKARRPLLDQGVEPLQVGDAGQVDLVQGESEPGHVIVRVAEAGRDRGAPGVDGTPRPRRRLRVECQHAAVVHGHAAGPGVVRVQGDDVGVVHQQVDQHVVLSPSGGSWSAGGGPPVAGSARAAPRGRRR